MALQSLPKIALPQFDASILSHLACPACHGELLFVTASLACATCGRTYPVVNGIPVLIADCGESSEA